MFRVEKGNIISEGERERERGWKDSREEDSEQRTSERQEETLAILFHEKISLSVRTRARNLVKRTLALSVTNCKGTPISFVVHHNRY